jgi:hypothetical protein
VASGSFHCEEGVALHRDWMVLIVYDLNPAHSPYSREQQMRY